MIVTQGLANGMLVTQGYGYEKAVGTAVIKLGGKQLFHYPYIGYTR